MAETRISMSKVAEYLMDPVVRYASYLICFNCFVRDVESVKCKLESTLAGVKERKEEARRGIEEITETVKRWINNVENILQEVHELQEKAKAGTNKCFHFSFKYYLAKEMDKKKKQMIKLNDNSKFDPFSYPIQLPAIHHFSTKDFVDFNSRKSTFNELLKAIKDDKNNRIGLYGIGGSGKTTLAKVVGKKVGEPSLFDKVVMAVVSQPTDVKKIQGQIADQFDLKLEQESNLGRAQKLSTRLKDGRHLIILDDVSDNLNLEDIGIPSNDNEGCCILLTTRIRQVCQFMNCQKIIELPLLTEEEAQDLFNQHANISNNTSNELKSVAKDIISECKGLPIAIVIVGRSLREKGLEEWGAALSRLKHSQPMDIDDELRGLYACLELCFKNLKSKVAKSLFLLCSMFPEDHDINKEDLVRFGMGALELTTNVDTIGDVRREIYTTINVLLDSCLLMSSNIKDCVKMHGLVRDVALWVAQKQGQAIMVARKEVPRLLVENEIVKDTEVISLWDLEEDFKLSDQLKCPTLKILLLQSENDDFGELDIYVEGMKALKVLALKSFSSYQDADTFGINWPLLRSIESLTNLSTLCLELINLGDISYLVNLKGLEILYLNGCSFIELPVGMVNMKKLKLLSLWGCYIKKSPYEVIRRCTQLQELYVCHQSKCPHNFSLPRLQRYVIYVSFEDASVSFEDNSNQIDVGMSSEDEYVSTCRFEGIFGNIENDKELDLPSRALYIKKGDKYSTLSSSLKDLFVKADFLWLDDWRWEGYREELFSMTKILVLSNSPNINILVDNSDVNIFQGLEEEHLNSDLSVLGLFKLPNLEYIWKGPPQILSLHKLISVQISECPKLKSIFTPTIHTTLPNLRDLWVVECEELEEIISINSEQLTNLPASSSTSSNINCRLPKLSTIIIRECNKLKCLFSYSRASHCPSLRELMIYNCSELEQVVYGDEGGGHKAGVLFPKLTNLELETLPKLTQIFPGFKYDQSLHHITECPSILLE